MFEDELFQCHSRFLATEARLLAVDEVEPSVLLVRGGSDGALVRVGHDPDVEGPVVA